MRVIGECRDCVYFRVTNEATEERPFAIGVCVAKPPEVVLIRMATPLTAEELQVPGAEMLPARGHKWESVVPTVTEGFGCGAFVAKEEN